MPRIAFCSSTRADYGKLKPLATAVRNSPDHEMRFFVTGMHLRKDWGATVGQFDKDGFAHWDCPAGIGMIERVSDVTRGMSMFLEDYRPDLVVIHGDRAEALACATAASIMNCRIAHLEGGERSGTIDGMLRHAISKMATHHLVATHSAANMLQSELGEDSARVEVIGSPEVDLLLHGPLPSLAQVSKRYPGTHDHGGLSEKNYGLLLFHPVTTNTAASLADAKTLVESLSPRFDLGERDWVVIEPNDEIGGSDIRRVFRRAWSKRENFRLLPSVRHDHFCRMMRDCATLVGNSSAGVRESPVYGVVSVDLGYRQQGRLRPTTKGEPINNPHVLSIRKPDVFAVSAAIETAWGRRESVSLRFGDGKSTGRFMKLLGDKAFWALRVDKSHVD